MPRFTVDVPPPPSVEGLIATATGASVVLSWDPSVVDPADFALYVVSRSVDGGSFVRVASLPDQAATTFADYTAPIGRPLVYRVVVETVAYEVSDPADVATLVDACEFWLVRSAMNDAGATVQIGFEVPNVSSMATVWPMQSAEHEPIGRRHKLVESGEMLGAETVVEALLLPDQADVARLIRTAAADVRHGDLLWKTPYGDVEAVVLGSMTASRGVGGRQTIGFRTIAVDDATDI